MTDQSAIKSVTVEYADGHWWVTIIENGEQHRQSLSRKNTRKATPQDSESGSICRNRKSPP
jgi:hypothetical protein